MAPRRALHVPPPAGRTRRKLYFFKGKPVTIDGQAEHPAAIELRQHAATELVNAPETSEFLLMQAIGAIADTAPRHEHAAGAAAGLPYRRTAFGGWPWPDDAPVARTATLRPPCRRPHRNSFTGRPTSDWNPALYTLKNNAAAPAAGAQCRWDAPRNVVDLGCGARQFHRAAGQALPRDAHRRHRQLGHSPPSTCATQLQGNMPNWSPGRRWTWPMPTHRCNG